MIQRFGICPKSFELHYLHRIRPTTINASLIFGSALDVALNRLLLENNGSEFKALTDAFTTTELNGEQVYVPTCKDIVYANTDFDSDLLFEADAPFITEELEKLGVQGCEDFLSTYKRLKDKKTNTGFNSLTDKEKSTYNLLNWVSLYNKGVLMLVAYKEQVLPKFNKVISVQEQVSLSNGEDSITGFIDLVADVKGHGTVILDNKTSAMEYAEDSVLLSAQLALYTHILEEKYKTRKAGFIVLRKQIIKNRKKICSKCGNDGSGARHKTCDAMVDGARCHGEWTETIDPRVNIQFIVNEIPQRTEEIVMENMDAANQAIKNGVFVRNFNACSNTYGGDCVYKQYCYSNSMKNLCKAKGR